MATHQSVVPLMVKSKRTEVNEKFDQNGDLYCTREVGTCTWACARKECTSVVVLSVVVSVHIGFAYAHVESVPSIFAARIIPGAVEHAERDASYGVVPVPGMEKLRIMRSDIAIHRHCSTG
jgi:hypothetical protein